MTRRTLVGVLVAGGLVGAASFAVVVATNDIETLAEPNPTTCEGYPEKRAYLENQSWVEPQPGPPGHPGTGQVGHIHVGTCFPLYQTVTSNTLSLDIRIQMHNVPGTPILFDVRAYNINRPNNLPNAPLVPACPVMDCDQWVHVDFPLSTLPESGWTEFHMNLHVMNTDGLKWYNVTRWFFNNANGKPPVTGILKRIGGDTWLTAVQPDTKYSEARIMDASFPWNFTTGQPIVKSGMWSPEVWFTGDEGRVLIDPALHAHPPNFGLEVWRGVPVDNPNVGGPQRMTINVDTTQLTDGPHRMLLISCDNRSNGTDNCGVLVVPFLVDNP